jgi:hypothetical protein
LFHRPSMFRSVRFYRFSWLPPFLPSFPFLPYILHNKPLLPTFVGHACLNLRIALLEAIL